VVSDTTRDLGSIEGREVPGSGGPVGAGEHHPVEPQSFSAPAVVRAPVDAAVAEAREAARDIRDAHRRGPKPNSRPLPNWVKRLAWVLDDAFSVPGFNGRRVGVDGMLTLVPVVGDMAGLVLSFVVVLAGVGAGVSIPTTLRMLLNVGFESLAGLVPFGGALFDMVYKANDRNVRLIEADLADRKGTRRSSLMVILGVLVVLFVGALMTVVVLFLGIALLVWFIGRLFS
jgi:hypothetical protein